MKKQINEAVKNCNTLSEIKDEVLKILEDLNKNGFTRIGYVSGIVTSDGPDKIAQNVKRLIKITNDIRKKYNFPIFSCTDVFNNKLIKKIDAEKYEYNDWLVFWGEILGNEKRYVTDIFMTPRWKESKGAVDEYKTAKNMKMKVFYVA